MQKPKSKAKIRKKEFNLDSLTSELIYELGKVSLPKLCNDAVLHSATRNKMAEGIALPC